MEMEMKIGRPEEADDNDDQREREEKGDFTMSTK